MKPFLAGVATALVAVALVAAATLFLVSRPVGRPPGPGATSSASPAASPTRPADLAAGETWLGDVELRSSDVVATDGSLTDVTARGAGVRFSDDGLRAERLALDATVPFDVVAARLGEDARVFAAGDGRAGIDRSVELLGRELRVRATGTVRADAGRLVLEPETVDVGGPSLLDDALSAAARGLVTIRQDVAGVPDGMTLTAVSVRPDGMRVRLTGAGVTVAR